MATDLLAAELDRIEDHQENGGLHDFATYDSPRLIAGYRALLKLHVPFRIYEDCGHDHEEVVEGVTDCGDFLACEDGHLYTVCRECCCGGMFRGPQTEECASDHERPCWPCGTVEAISAALLGREDDDA